MSIPKDGTVIVLSPAQISNWDLVCAFKHNYIHTEIIAQKPIPMFGPGGLMEPPMYRGVAVREVDSLDG